MTHICRQDLLTWGRLLKPSTNWGKWLPKSHYGPRDPSEGAVPPVSRSSRPPAQVGKINTQSTGSRLGVWQGNHLCCQVCISTAEHSLASNTGDHAVCLHPSCNPSFSSSPSYNGNPSLETILWMLFPFIAQIFLTFLRMTQRLPGIRYFPLIFHLKQQQKGKLTSAANTLWASNGWQMSEWEPLTYRFGVNSG